MRWQFIFWTNGKLKFKGISRVITLERIVVVMIIVQVFKVFISLTTYIVFNNVIFKQHFKVNKRSERSFRWERVDFVCLRRRR